MKSYTQTIGNIVDKYKYNQLELNPPYQRRSVWKTRQRTLLLSSIFNGIPIPALIFHKHFDQLIFHIQALSILKTSYSNHPR